MRLNLYTPVNIPAIISVFHFSLYSSLFSLTTAHHLVKRVVNGDDVSVNEAPWFVRILAEIDCGGVWITSTTLLTSAHCFRPWTKRAYVHFNDDNKRYGTGGYFRTTDWVINSKWKRCIHKKRDWTGKICQHFGNDIAIVKTGRDPKLYESERTPSHVQQVLRIASVSETIAQKKPGHGFLAYGFGLTEAGGKKGHNFPKGFPSKVLQKVELPWVESKNCRKFASNHKVTTSLDIICTRHAEKSICYGDSGGPLVRNGILFGLTAIMMDYCASGAQGFTPVSSHLSWIMENSDYK